MVKRKQADTFEFTADEDEQDALITLGKQLSAVPKSKDILSRLLKKAGVLLEKIPQGSEGATLAIGDLSKALGKKELVKHKDKEIRLCTALCLCQVLRIYAPNTPYADDNLREIFGVLNLVIAELEDHTCANFPTCLSIIETVSQVKCCILLLDLDADDVICELFTSLFGAINDENWGMIQHSALELMGSLLEESDFVSQQLLDTVLVSLLPNREQENRAACRLAQQLLQRTESSIQPYLQKFLTDALLGIRTDSDLKDDCHSLIFKLYQVVPQVLLPVLPHLSLELQVDSESKRLSAADLLGKLFTQPGSSDISKDYADLFQDLLKRLHDQKVEVRLKVLSFCKGLLDNCVDVGMRRYIIQGILDRLLDVDDRVRIAAASMFCEIMARSPKLAATGLDPVLGRLRDKKINVRKEVASQVVGLIRAWCLKIHQTSDDAPKLQQVIAPVLVLCNLATRDADLGNFVIDNLLKNGMFPSKVPESTQVQWWAYMWHKAGDVGRASLAKLLKNKCNLQRQVRDLIYLRTAAKDQRQGGGATISMAASGTGSALQPSTSAGSALGDPEGALQGRTHMLAKSLHDVPRAEEGLQKLWELKDNHIFRGIAALATFGTSFEQAAATGKDVLQRVGAKGVAADAARALVNRMCPSFLSPELLQATMGHAAESEQAQSFLMDMAVMAPQLFAQSLDHVVKMLEQDDPVLAVCAAKVLAKAGKYMASESRLQPQPDDVWKRAVAQVEGTLRGMCTGTSPSGAKAAVCALVTLLGSDRASKSIKDVCDNLMDIMKQPSTLNHHPKLLTAMKAMSTVGRMLPQLFANYADEYVNFISDQLLKEDLSRGKPLRPAVESPGEEWGSPTPGIALKAAALKCLAQSLVPDALQGKPSNELVESVEGFLAQLVQLVNPDEESPDFDQLGLTGTIDAAWVRCAAGSCMLRLARGHDHSINADIYVELALSLQDPHPDARRQLANKVVRTVEHFKSSPQRAAKYAALLGLLAVDPVEANQSAAFKALREYVAFRRKQLHASAQATAAAGGAGNMIQAMPEFILPFVVFILSHHPDYPAAEELQEWEDLEEDERGELEEAGQGSPLAPFQTMLQFVLEPLILPSEGVIRPSEVAQSVPATLKLLRTLKFCEDAASEDEQKTENAYQLCDVAMAFVKGIVDRATKGKPVEPGRFPGSVVLPRMCFKPKDMRSEVKKADGSHLPVNFTPKLSHEFFSQRFAKMSLPPSTKKPRARSKLGNRQGSSKQPMQPPEISGRGAEHIFEGVADEAYTQPSQGASEPLGAAPDSSGKQEHHRQGDRQHKQSRPNQPVHAAPSSRDLMGMPAPDAAPSKRKRVSPGAAKAKRSKAQPSGAQGSLRMQPRRGAKAVAAEKLKKSDNNQDEHESSSSGDGDPMSQSDFENASMGSPAPGPASASQALEQTKAQGLRAETDDEKDAQSQDAQPACKIAKKQLPRGRGAKQATAKCVAAKSHPAAKKAKTVKAGSPAVLKPKSRNIRA